MLFYGWNQKLSQELLKRESLHFFLWTIFWVWNHKKLLNDMSAKSEGEHFQEFDEKNYYKYRNSSCFSPGGRRGGGQAPKSPLPNGTVCVSLLFNENQAQKATHYDYFSFHYQHPYRCKNLPLSTLSPHFPHFI